MLKPYLEKIGENTTAQRVPNCLKKFTLFIYPLKPDTEKPKIYCPPNQEVKPDGSAITVKVYWPAPIYSDNSGLPITIFTESINGSDFQLGQHQITYSATDHVGLRSECTFIIVVSGKLQPH